MVQRETLADQVVQEVINLIEELGLRPGDEIPAEGELARRFGVNRLVVREAVRTLVAREILVSSQGRPSRVSVPSSRVFGQMLDFRLLQHSLDIEELTQTRVVIEGELARLAAQHRDADVEQARALLDRQRESVDDPERFVRLDVAFHAAIGELGGNRMLRLLLDSLAEVLLQVRRASYDGRTRHGQDHHCTTDAHAAILDAVERGDSAAAERLMVTHLAETAADLDLPEHRQNSDDA